LKPSEYRPILIKVCTADTDILNICQYPESRYRYFRCITNISLLLVEFSFRYSSRPALCTLYVLTVPLKGYAIYRIKLTIFLSILSWS